MGVRPSIRFAWGVRRCILTSHLSLHTLRLVRPLCVYVHCSCECSRRRRPCAMTNHWMLKLNRFFSSLLCVFVGWLVSGASNIKITKDGNVLLHEMQIQHPTASLIARASTAQDDMTGDGTTSTVLLIGELLKQADIFLCEGLHPRILTEGFDLARVKSLEILDELKVPIEVSITPVSLPLTPWMA